VYDKNKATRNADCTECRMSLNWQNINHRQITQTGKHAILREQEIVTSTVVRTTVRLQTWTWIEDSCRRPTWRV